MQQSLSERKPKQDDLSTYIKKELSTLLKQVQQTPPKKCSSLKKIHHIVSKSSLPLSEKLSIERKIKRVQSVIQRTQSIDRIKTKLKNEPKSANKYEKKLFYQNMILEEKQMNLKNKLENKNTQMNQTKRIQPRRFLNLIEIFEDLRTQRLKHQHEIQLLSLKAQKLQQLIELKKENEQKLIQSAIIAKKYRQKKETLQQIRNEVKQAAKQNRKKLVNMLMKKFNSVQES